MSVSDAEYAAWLSSPSAMRCVLIEASVNVGGSEVVRYMSDKGYVTSPTDTPSNTNYRAIIVGGVKLTESLSIDSNPTLTWGNIEIANVNGEFDSWLSDIWNNRQVSVYFGDMKWARSDFRLVFKGMASSISSQRRDRLNIILADSLQRLNTPMTDTRLGGTTSNKDKLLPLTFGECHNVSPLLVDPVLHDYQVHQGAIESIIEVRDNGAPITVTPTLSTGKFRLSGSPVGTITASVQGNKPSTYDNSIAGNIKYIVKNYGTSSNRLTDSDIDLTNFSNFASANTAPIGVYLSERANVLEVCQQIAGSVGAQVTMSRLGLLQLLRIDFPPSGTPTLITASDMLERNLSVDSMVNVTPSIKIGYCKNWTVQNNLQTVIPEEHKALFALEYLTTTQSDSTVATNYKMLVEPTEKDTLLLTTSDANTEASRQLTNTKTQRTVYKFTGFAKMLSLTLGQAVTLKHNRYGLSSGKTGVVVGLEPDWINYRVVVKVMI